LGGFDAIRASGALGSDRDAISFAAYMLRPHGDLLSYVICEEKNGKNKSGLREADRRPE
jgi:hypothetical protein